MDQTRINQQKEHQDKKNEQQQESTSGLKTFTPPHFKGNLIPPQNPNILQRMQALPENERPAKLQPNIIQRMQALPEEERPEKLKPNLIQRIQRKKEEEHKLQMKKEEKPPQLKKETKEPLQMKFQAPAESNNLPPYQLNTDTGSKIPEEIRTRMETSFGTDFSGVNIHANSDKAPALNALAFTQGNNIHFAPGQYNPDSQKGQELLGHELTHVVQQRQGKVQATTQLKGAEINDSETLEKEADEMGEKAAKGEPNEKGKDGKGSGDDYKNKILNSPEYKNFKENPDSPLSKWEQFHSQGEQQMDGEIAVHVSSNSNNTYTSLALKYQTTPEKLKLLNQDLEKKYGNVIPAGSHVKLWGSNQFEQLESFTSEDTIFEFAAHHLAYKPAFSMLNKAEVDILGAAGYSIDHKDHQWIVGDIGFQALLIKSATKGKPDLLAIRGTNPGGKSDDMLTIYADTDPTGVGYQQLIRNQQTLEAKVFSLVDGKIDVTGHSLGGGMAQYVASRYPGRVRKVITFQAPGIDAASVKKFSDLPEEQRPEVVHHTVKGDLVDKSGDASLPGLVVEHDFGIKQDDTRVIKQKFLASFGLLKADYLLLESYLKSLWHEFDQITSYDQWQDFVPVYRQYKDFVHMKKMVEDCGPLYSAAVKMSKDGKDLLDYMKFVGAGVGEAHLKFVCSSSDNRTTRTEVGITDEFLLRDTDEELRKKHLPGPGGAGLDKENVGEPSASSVNYVYPHTEQRKTGEEVRDVVGNFINKHFTTEEMVALTREIEEILSLIEALKIAYNEGSYRSAYRIGKTLFNKTVLFYNKYKPKLDKMFGE